MGHRLEIPAGAGHVALVAVAERADGDFAIDSPGVEQRRRTLVDLPWTWLHQVHGTTTVAVDAPGAAAGARADAAVAAVPGAVVAVQTADCAPVILVGDGVVAAVHAGWRGLLDGVLEVAVDAVRTRGDDPVAAWLGPCIGPECYEFGAEDLALVVERCGPAAAGTSAGGGPALDLPAAVAAVLASLDVEVVGSDGRCTACDAATCWSHRARVEPERHAIAAWLEERP